MFPLLDTVDDPTDLKRLPIEALPQLAEELRLFLLESLHDVGGHLGAGLGVVELTIALHYVFDTPTDCLVWDVGHQAYPHKILTQRKKQFHRIRQKDGLAPFPRREESIFDTFGVGHSSTSISAALGMALADQHLGKQNHHVAIIGDGAMTAGMAFEALNHAGDVDCDLLVILNDNDMSISGNVGALSKYFSRLLSSKWYTHFREGSNKMLKVLPKFRELAHRTETHLKGLLLPGTVFEEMGFHYTGPIDGHDVIECVKTLNHVKTLKGPQFLHVVTKKGKGYAPAEADPIGYHAVSKGFYLRSPAKDFPETVTPKTSKTPTFSEVFGEWLCTMAEREPRLYGITPAMCEGSGMVKFAQQYKERYIDVGIAEQHSITLAAGLACQGMKPVVAIYSTFLQRAYDQLIHDVAIQQLPVLLAIDRAGLVADGPTHSGNFDLSYLSCIPNMLIMAPADEQACWDMLNTGFEYAGPAAVRYPRGKVGRPFERRFQSLAIGKAHVVKQGAEVAILCFGTLLWEALPVAEKLNATLVDMRFVKPLDQSCIQQMALSHRCLVTLEENVTTGGAGSAVLACLASLGIEIPVLCLGLPDHFVEHASQEEMRAACGLDATGIQRAIEEKVSKISCKNPEIAVQFPS